MISIPNQLYIVIRFWCIMHTAHVLLVDYWRSKPCVFWPIRNIRAARKFKRRAYSSFCMVQLNTTSKPALGKQAQLRNEKFVDLHVLLTINPRKMLKWLTCFFRDQLHYQDLELVKDGMCKNVERLYCSVKLLQVYIYIKSRSGW